MLALLVFLLSGQLPRVDVTPGVARTLSAEAVCSTRWGRDPRKVTVAMKKRVAAAYGVSWAERGAYEFDHLIPRSLGGADDERNLWPQPLSSANQKDRLELALGRKVCSGEMSLAAAQEAIRLDWLSAYQRHVGTVVKARRRR